MADPNLALQGAIYTLLGTGAGGTALAAIAGCKVYDEIPKGAQFPYVNIGEFQCVGDDTEDCGDGSEIFVRIHAWSRAVGGVEVKQIAAAIRSILRGTIPALSGHVVSVVEFVQTQYLLDPDGLTKHAVIEFRYLISDSN